MEAGGRKAWLDWQRGLAVVFMVVWHTWDAWRGDAVVQTQLHAVVNLIGGMAAPSFLYMAGLSQVLGDEALARKGLPAGVRRVRALRRGGWLLAMAYLFRVTEYVLGGAFLVPGGWRDLLRVDVLNVIAVAFVLSALVTVGLGRRATIALAAATTLLVVALAPIVAGWQHAPSRVLDYLYSEWPRGIFHVFPWAGFCVAGSALAAFALRRPPGRPTPGPWAWTAIGVGLFAAGWAGDALPPVYRHQDFWRTSPSWFAMRLGVVVSLSGALQLLPVGADRALSWLRLIGRHSLLCYFFSVEIPYGGLTHALHRRLEPESLVPGIAFLIAATCAVAAAAERYDAWRRPARVAPIRPGTGALGSDVTAPGPAANGRT